MYRAYRFEDIPKLEPPINFTIGTFDGVHLGHQMLIKELVKERSALLTFSNHPLSFFKPDLPIKELMTLEQKCAVFEKLGVDLVIALPFDKGLADLTYDAFVKKLRTRIPFTKLILGKGACFGKGARGDEKALTALGKDEGFETLYLDKKIVDGAPVSSMRIRSLIDEGNSKSAKKLLGH